jgi:YVTN family beta-propeller protein
MATPGAGSFPDSDVIIYTTNSGQNTVSIVDIWKNTIAGSLAGFNVPFRLAFSPDYHRAYVADAGSNSTIVIDTTTNSQIARVSLDQSPLCIALSPDGTKAYVTVGSDSVAIIDTVSCSRAGTIKVGTLPWGICVNPRTGDVYVLNMWDKSVSIIKGNSVVATVPLDGYLDNGLAVTPDGSRLFVADHCSKVYVIDTANYTVLTTINTGQESDPVGVAFSPDGADAYIACSRAGKIKIFSTDSYAEVNELSVPSPDKIVVGPSGRVIYALSSTSGLKTIDTVTGSTFNTVSPGANDFAVARITWNVVLPDPTPPTTALELAGPVDSNGAFIGEVRCTLTAVDNEGGSGVKSIEYCLPGQLWTPYSSPFNITRPGSVTLMYRATDYATNLEPSRSRLFYIVSPQDAAMPTPVPCPSPSPPPVTAHASPTALPVTTASPTPTAVPAEASPTPVATPATTAVPTPMAMPSAGFEGVAAFIGVACAGCAHALGRGRR